MTSTLQQEASRKLRFGAKQAMSVAQRLYEKGWITYMRTDSTTLSDEALAASRGQAAELYGPDYVPDKPRRYERKVKNAQEAHEAIRPAGESFRTPDQAAAELPGDESRLYDLIWKRTVASQMADATGTSAQVRLVGMPTTGFEGAAPQEAEFAASGQVISFPGFLRAYVEGSDDPEADLAQREVQLPALSEGDVLSATALEPKSHTTQPPARYTEASLVKHLEDLGVGRPSTYASILGTIQERGYVWKKGTALVPSFTAFAVVGLLEQYFGNLVDYGFTAAMENDLDEIAEGAQEALPWLTRFYFGETANGNGAAGHGDDHRGLKEDIATHLGEIDAREVNSIPIGDDAEGRAVVARVGRYGPYLQREEERASIPEDLPPDELTLERAEEMLAAPSGDRTLGTHPEEQLPVIARTGRFGPYVQLGEAVDGGDKPRTASLFKTMDLDTVTLADALQLLTLPRSVGADPATGEEILALNGRFGPYLKKGTDTRSLAGEEELLTVTLDEARALFAQPKRGRGRAAAAPLKELGDDLCDRRDDERVAAPGRRRGDDHPRAGHRAPLRPPRRGAPGQAGQEGGQVQEGGQEDDHGGQEGDEGDQEDDREDDEGAVHGEGGPGRRGRRRTVGGRDLGRRGPRFPRRLSRTWPGTSVRGRRCAWPPDRPRGDRREREDNPGPALRLHHRGAARHPDGRTGSHRPRGRAPGPRARPRSAPGGRTDRGPAPGGRPGPARGRGGGAGPRGRPLGGHRPLLGVDPGLPGLRARSRPRRPPPADRLGHGRDRTGPERAGRRPSGGGPPAPVGRS
jgi:hypothetical protein